MAYQVFLSHSLDTSEQALAWRLQTLAAAHGIQIYVPPRGFRALSRTKAPVSEIQKAIDRADCVLAIITARADGDAQRELKYALLRRKLVIPIVESSRKADPLLAQFPRVFAFSPSAAPGTLESQVMEFLKAQRVKKDQQQAIGALVALGVALLLLFSLSEK